MKRADHYLGSYDREAKKVREAAYADPNTRCWRCGKTLFEHGPRVRWTAGHLLDGVRDSPLAAEASSCNSAAGARLRNARAAGRTPRLPQGPVSKLWR